MFTLIRWWDKHWLSVILATLALGGGYYLRHTKGASIAEIYYLISLPFQRETIALQQKQLSNARIVELESRLAELNNQNKQLKKLVGYAQNRSKPSIIGAVIGRSSDQWWRQVVVGVGSNKGIKKGFIVTGIGGLVGKVESVTSHTSRVLLISDYSSRVGVVVSRTRSMGYIQGKGGNLVLMKFFEKTPQVRTGDIIATSPVSSVFPDGLPIGKVKSVNLAKSPTPEAIVELTAPIDYLEWVVIEPFSDKDIP